MVSNLPPKSHDDDYEKDGNTDDNERLPTPSSNPNTQASDISFLSATMIVTSFSTAGASITMPYSVGQFGKIYIYNIIQRYILITYKFQLTATFFNSFTHINKQLH